MAERINETLSFDVLGDVLETLRFKGTIFFKSDLAAPWGMSMSKTSSPRFHISLDGNFFVGSDKQKEAMHIGEMEVLLLTKGDAHWIADKPGRPLIESEEAGMACELGNPLFQDGKITNSIMCGQIRFDKHAVHPFIHSMTEVIHMTHGEMGDSLWQIVKLIESVLNESQTFNNTVVDRLAEALFLKLIQEKIASGDKLVGFMAALSDRRLKSALQCLHENIQKAWTLQLLADEVGMSRATLVRHFRETVGMAPMEYLTQWRMTKAIGYLKFSTLTLENIAEKIGFSSSQSFSKAFKREMGYSPMTLRSGQID